jgi:hypothetical protein
LYRDSRGNTDLELHLLEGLEWLKRAQDAGTNRGVSYGVDFGGAFLESYPETTGYIIPTLLKLADYYNDGSLLQRALEMGDWESAVQMDNGAVMGGRLNSNPTPAVFNTGMVLLGWSALVKRTGNLKCENSLRRACNWLLSVQESDGDWRRGNSLYANAHSTVYNVKAAWGLCEAGSVADIPAAVDGAVRNAEFCLSKQSPNGWFSDCCLTDGSQPLLHTIAYSMQGLVGIGTIVHRADFIEAAIRTADSLVGLMDKDGFIPGRIGPDFKGTVDWCCLTGTAQTAIVWGRLFQLTGNAAYKNAMHCANAYLMRHHDIENSDTCLRGGVPGSWPVWGDYGRLMILNWATNFFVESLLLQKSIDGVQTPTAMRLKRKR